MNKILRKVSIIVGLFILVGGLYASSQIGKGINKEKKTATEKPTEAAITNYAYTKNVKNQTIGSEVTISGKVIARQKIDLYSEVTGRLTKAGKEFREGVSFQKGALMLTLDKTDAVFDLQSAKSQLYSALVAMLPDIENDYTDNIAAWKSYVDAFDIDQPIKELPKPKDNREKLYLAIRNIHNQYIAIRKQEHRLTKYQIYAPFTGVLSNATVYEGALVRSGQRLGTLTHPSRYEVEATVSLYDLQFFKIGNTVNLYSEATNQTWQGRIVRMGKTIDEKTQTQRVFIAVNSSQLNEGMFLNGKVQTKNLDNVVQLPRALLINNGAVYTVKEGQLQLQSVEVIKVDNNTMYVRGLADDTKVLTRPILGAFEGMKVKEIE